MEALLYHFFYLIGKIYTNIYIKILTWSSVFLSQLRTTFATRVFQKRCFRNWRRIPFPSLVSSHFLQGGRRWREREEPFLHLLLGKGVSFNRARVSFLVLSYLLYLFCCLSSRQMSLDARARQRTKPEARGKGGLDRISLELLRLRLGDRDRFEHDFIWTPRMGILFSWFEGEPSSCFIISSRVLLV